MLSSGSFVHGFYRPASVALLLLLLLLATTASTGQFVIDEVYSTTHNATQVVQRSNPDLRFSSGSPRESSTNSTPTSSDVVGVQVLDRQVQQQVTTLGAGVTDAASIVLQAFKAAHPDEYWELLNLLYSQDPQWLERGGAGLNACRSPLGASDFGLAPYTYDDTFDGSTDEDLSLFTLDKAPKMWATLRDIQSVNRDVRLYFAPWSPPGWMKQDAESPNQPLYGGTLKPKSEATFARYLSKAMTAIQREKGLQPYSLSVQNEPFFSSDKYPTARMTPDQLAAVGDATRRLLNEAGLGAVKLLAYDHNWDRADRAIEVLDKSRGSTWSGVAWHCYAGEAPAAQKNVSAAYPDKEVHMTECTTITQFNKEPWENLKEKATSIVFGSVRARSEAVLFWNVALQVDEDGMTMPHLPQVCKNCQAPILLSADATVSNATAPLADGNGTRLRTVEMANEAAPRDDQPGPSKRDLGVAPLDRQGLYRRRYSDEPLQPSLYPRADDKAAPLYRQTSDFMLLAHLQRAVGPRRSGGPYGFAINSRTTDGRSDPQQGRVLAQAFRTDEADPNRPGWSRWSVVLLNQNDHFETGNFEDLTVEIAFRGMVANFTSGPGLYTISWLAPKTADD